MKYIFKIQIPAPITEFLISRKSWEPKDLHFCKADLSDVDVVGLETHFENQCKKSPDFMNGFH